MSHSCYIPISTSKHRTHDLITIVGKRRGLDDHESMMSKQYFQTPTAVQSAMAWFPAIDVPFQHVPVLNILHKHRKPEKKKPSLAKARTGILKKFRWTIEMLEECIGIQHINMRRGHAPP